MIDSNVFAELQNRGIITHTGLEAENFNDISKLVAYGIATSTLVEEVYKDVLEDIAEVDDIVKKFLDDIAAGGNVVVPMNIELDAPLAITKDVVLDLNGCTLESASDVFDVSAKLIINGNGKIVAATDNTCSWCAVFAHDNADVTITGG